MLALILLEIEYSYERNVSQHSSWKASDEVTGELFVFRAYVKLNFYLHNKFD